MGEERGHGIFNKKQTEHNKKFNQLGPFYKRRKRKDVIKATEGIRSQNYKGQV